MAISIKPAVEYIPIRSHNFMKSMASGGLARFIALEACVETGRTYQAAQRGGFDEGRERITEEFTGAVFWLGGVKAFNAINDKIGQFILKLRTTNFDLGKDKARDTVKNFLHAEKDTVRNLPFTEKQIAAFKSTKLIASILMANAMIGFVVPRINQSITRYYHRNDVPKLSQEDLNRINTGKDVSQKAVPELTGVSMNKFIEKAKARKDVSFGGGADKLMSLAFNLENNTTWQLLSTDVGTASGRAISARNNDERREILFRDLSSIYFYMFNMPLMNSFLNRVEQKGRKTRVEPMNADYTADLMKQIVKENGGSINADKFAQEMFGKYPEFKLPNAVKEQFKGGAMNFEEFKKLISSIPVANTPELTEHYTEIAKRMSELQPKIAEDAKITLEQAERVFKGGYLNNPEFMKNLYELEFGTDAPAFKNFFRRLTGKPEISGSPNYLNPYKFISTEAIERVDGDLKFFVEQIVDKAKKSGKEITEEMIEKAVKSNSRLNALNWGAGFVVSALFLSTIIPKVQYWITKKITGSNAFPGTEQYRKQQEAQQQSQVKTAA